MDLFTYKRALAIAEAEIQSKLNTEEKLNELRVKIAVFKQKIKELESQSSSEDARDKNRYTMTAIIETLKPFKKHIINIAIGLIIAYCVYAFGWNK